MLRRPHLRGGRSGPPWLRAPPFTILYYTILLLYYTITILYYTILALRHLGPGESLTKRWMNSWHAHVPMPNSKQRALGPALVPKPQLRLVLARPARAKWRRRPLPSAAAWRVYQMHPRGSDPMEDPGVRYEARRRLPKLFGGLAEADRAAMALEGGCPACAPIVKTP